MLQMNKLLFIYERVCVVTAKKSGVKKQKELKDKKSKKIMLINFNTQFLCTIK